MWDPGGSFTQVSPQVSAMLPSTVIWEARAGLVVTRSSPGAAIVVVEVYWSAGVGQE